jgi:6-phosphofructokinase 1
LPASCTTAYRLETCAYEDWSVGVDVEDLEIRTLGECTIPSPLSALLEARKSSQHYVVESDRVLVDDTLASASERGVLAGELPGFEPGGPRPMIFFQPETTRAGIVTCGGLCPGLNDVIKALVMELSQHYGISEIIGFRNGFQGLIDSYGHPLVPLTPESVSDINEIGGTVLGTSRGKQDHRLMVDRLVRERIDILFVVGGDGSLRGALRIADEAAERGAPIAIVGVPKTIDNDIPFIDQSFGFQTAFSKATESIRAAYVEARAAPNGVGLVRLMGRHSGFIACYAALANHDADYVLIPEIPFTLEGDNGFLAHLRRRVGERGHAVVVIAEGAGQHLVHHADDSRDASGNVKLSDIGVLLRERIIHHFDHAGLELNLRYIDPSYSIRSVRADAYDRVYCIRLAHAAVHAAMAGRTAMVVGRWHGRFVHLPIPLVVSTRNTVDPDGDMWLSVLEMTGQPRVFG